MGAIRVTPLHEWHVSRNANMAVFGGYDMPLWYPAGAKKEHLAPITSAGMFDTSHMAVVIVRGTGSYQLLQKCFSRDLERCSAKGTQPIYDGQCVYGVFLNDLGHVIDDAIINRIHEKKYMVVVNAGMGGIIAEHLSRNTRHSSIRIDDLTDRVGKLDVQGPCAGKILRKILKNPDEIFQHMPYFTFKGGLDASDSVGCDVRLDDDTKIILSRSGYTGEFGFELFTPVDRVAAIWKKLIDAGSEFGAIACGLAARDSLRAGAVLPLSHQDIGHWPFINNPWEFALPFDSEKRGFTKSFIGSDALLNPSSPSFTFPFAGFDLRKITIDENAAVLDEDENEIGIPLTCATDMAIGRHERRIFSIVSPEKPENFKAKGLCCGFVKVRKPLSEGSVVFLKDARRKIRVEIVRDIRPCRTARKKITDMM